MKHSLCRFLFLIIFVFNFLSNAKYASANTTEIQADFPYLIINKQTAINCMTLKESGAAEPVDHNACISNKAWFFSPSTLESGKYHIFIKLNKQHYGLKIDPKGSLDLANKSAPSGTWADWSLVPSGDRFHIISERNGEKLALRFDTNGKLNLKKHDNLEDLAGWTKFKIRKFFSYESNITLNPEELHQSVKFGADIKLTLNHYSNNGKFRSTNNISSKLFSEMKMKIVRIPIYAHHNADDIPYSYLSNVIDSIKAYNPSIELFASLANGTYENNWLHGAIKFPEEMRSPTNVGNIYNLDLKQYASRIDDYIDRLKRSGHTIKYFGAFNEDPTEPTDYIKLLNSSIFLPSHILITNEDSFLARAVQKAPKYKGLSFIQGAHVYDDESIGIQNQEKYWRDFKNASSSTIWHTEATRFEIADSLQNLLSGLINILPAINGGAEAVIIYQAIPRLVKANGDTHPYKYSGIKNLINTTENKKVISSSSDDSGLYISSFSDTNTLSTHIVNDDIYPKRLNIRKLNQDNNDIGSLKVIIWSKDKVGKEQAGNNRSGQYNRSNFTISIPAKSYVYVEM